MKGLLVVVVLLSLPLVTTLDGEEEKCCERKNINEYGEFLELRSVCVYACLYVDVCRLVRVYGCVRDCM